MNSLLTGLSALTASQQGLSLTGDNIANANTDGYHRQRLVLEPRWLGGVIGQGVDVKTVQRLRDALVEGAITRNKIEAGQNDAELDSVRQLESLLSPGAGSLGERTANLFGQFQQLAARPDDASARQSVLSAARGLAESFNRVGSGIDQLRNSLRGDIDQTVNQINDYATRIADFNQRIQVASLTGQPPNELMDQRDVVVNHLAALVDVRTTDLPYGVVDVVAANILLVGGNTAEKVAVQTEPTGQLSLVSQGGTVPLSLVSGKLAGQFSVYNQSLPAYQQQLSTLVQEIVGGIDSIQATGLGLSGPATSQLGSRAVTSPAALLSASTALPVQAGTLTVSVTDPSGQRTLTRVNVDPATQTLASFAAALTAATSGQVQATVTSDNLLQLQAQPGYSFDFAGRLPSTPTNIAMSGTAVPSLTGLYSGAANGTYSFQVVGSGTVGTTAGLSLEVRDTGNNLIATLNIGQGYTPGTALDAGNGLKVSLSAGTTNAGSFDAPVTSDPDTSGILAALGVGSLFSGSTATDLAVRLTSTNDLAASRDGQAGDGSNLARLLEFRTRSDAEADIARLVAEAGQGVKDREDKQTALGNLAKNLQAQQQGVSGIDPNEEIAQMLQYQQMFQQAAKYISVINSTLDSLLSIIR